MNAKLRTFKVNEYITLKLERNRTNIYVNGKLFRQCKYILLNIPADGINKLDEIQSIDEAAQLLDHSQEPRYDEVISQIPPEVEFWAHSSNLQAWAENDYDTRLIHRNLAFPLLRELAEAGDPKARVAFKEEITKRLENSHPAVVEYLKEEGYLDYLSHEEQIFALLESIEAEALLAIEQKHGIEFEIVEENDLEYDSPKSDWYIGISNRSVLVLRLGSVDINSIINIILEFSNLQSISFEDKKMVKLPEKMKELDSLKRIAVVSPLLGQIPDWILDFKNLKIFAADGDSLERKAIKNVKKMKEKGVSVEIF